MASQQQWDENRLQQWIDDSLTHINNIKSHLKPNIRTIKQARRSNQQDSEHINLVEVEVANKEIKAIEEDWRKVSIIMKQCLDIKEQAHSAEVTNQITNIKELLDGIRRAIVDAIGQEKTQTYIQKESMGAWEQKNVFLSKLKLSGQSTKLQQQEELRYSQINVDDDDDSKMSDVWNEIDEVGHERTSTMEENALRREALRKSERKQTTKSIVCMSVLTVLLIIMGLWAWSQHSKKEDGRI